MSAKKMTMNLIKSYSIYSVKNYVINQLKDADIHAKCEFSNVNAVLKTEAHFKKDVCAFFKAEGVFNVQDIDCKFSIKKEFPGFYK